MIAGIEFTIGNLITISLSIIGFVFGYAKLNGKVQEHDKAIKEIIDCRQRRQNDMKNEFEKKLIDLKGEMIAIRQQVKQISKQLSKLTGILEIYIKNN